MSVNQVFINGEEILSTRGNTVTEDTLVQGKTAQDKTGKTIEGKLDPVTEEELDEVKEQLNELSDDVYKVSDEEGEIEETDYIPFNDISDVNKPKKKALLSSIIDKIKSAFLPIKWGHVELIQSSDVLAIKDKEVDASESDNGVTAIHYPSSNSIVDNESRILSRYEAVVKPSGDIYAKMYARNYDTNGNTVGSNSIEAGVDKSGNSFYYVTDPDKFRKAINTIDQMGTKIPANSDLNDYTTAGTYYVENNGDAGTISNMPLGVAYSGKLIVLDMDSNVRVDQIYITNYNGTGDLVHIYARQIDNNGVAKPWREVTAPHTYELGIEIPANADLNTYTTEGVYQCNLSATARTMSNLPYTGDDRRAFKLIVNKVRNSTNILQIYTSYINENNAMANSVAYRLSDNNGSTWWLWHHVADNDAVAYLNQPDLAHQISANEDLDDYTASGTYQCNNGSIATTLSNCPVTTSFKLVVDRAYARAESEIMQKITMRNTGDDPVEYVRVRAYNQTTWGAWKKYASTDDITPANVGNGYAEATVSGSAITATITGFKLRAGVIVAIRIVPEISSACTLNINNTGAKSVKFWSNEDVSFGKPIGGARITTFIYDGTYYRVISIDKTPHVGNQSYVADTSGNILIDWGYGSNRAQLKYNVGSNKLLWNYYKNSAWRGDVVLADYDDLITWGQKAIPTGSDLNNYNTIGVYSIRTASIAQNTANIPIALSGKLIVVALTSTDSSQSWKAQFYIPNHEEHFYQRVKTDNDGWRPWVEYANTNQLGASIAKVGKSILPIWKETTNVVTRNGITFTFNPSTGETTANGTATADAWCQLFSGKLVTTKITLPKGSYVLSGCPSGGSDSKYFLILYAGDSAWKDYGSGNTFTLSYDYLLDNDFSICIKSGQTVSNIVFKPMLRPAFTTADFEPCEDIHKGNCYVGTCTTAGGTKDKVAYVDGYFVLRKGVRVAIKFSNTNTYSNATANPITLNVNGTGAKNIWYNQNHSGAGNTGTNGDPYGVSSRYNYYIYDGTYWVWDGHGVDNNSTYSNQSLGNGYGTCTTAEATTAKVVTLSGYNLTINGYVSVKFTYNVPANATMNINSKGAKNIWYRGANITANVIKAGDLATFIYDGTRYQLVANDRWGGKQLTYVMNAGGTLPSILTIDDNNLTVNQCFINIDGNTVSVAMGLKFTSAKTYSSNTLLIHGFPKQAQGIYIFAESSGKNFYLGDNGNLYMRSTNVTAGQVLWVQFTYITNQYT